MLDSHVLLWLSSEPERLSRRARAAIDEVDELTVASITWFELSWLAAHERIALTIPASSWLDQLSRFVRTLGLTPAVAHAAVALPEVFPGDPADRIIYATAVVHGFALVTKDRRLRDHRYPHRVTVW